MDDMFKIKLIFFFDPSLINLYGCYKEKVINLVDIL